MVVSPSHHYVLFLSLRFGSYSPLIMLIEMCCIFPNKGVYIWGSLFYRKPDDWKWKIRVPNRRLPEERLNLSPQIMNELKGIDEPNRKISMSKQTSIQRWEQDERVQEKSESFQSFSWTKSQIIFEATVKHVLASLRLHSTITSTMNSTDPAEWMIIRSPNWKQILWTTEKEHVCFGLWFLWWYHELDHKLTGLCNHGGTL